MYKYEINILINISPAANKFSKAFMPKILGLQQNFV